ncbi:DUF4214 domain-containing protein [Sulfitobacter geojensis]|uniref:DUF4214 domain-containing protein n=1 Tax=Sulfitobacter geojensis TaxID=1342299 RepID=UPI0024935A40|nr:DUF4214 domain-containing protein [Sulfitobacter geojensis]
MPLPVAALAAIGAIGLVADVLSIYSFFGSSTDDDARAADLDQLKSDLSSLQNLPGIVVNVSVAESLGQADTALDNLALYRTTEDAAARGVLANNAILASQGALNDIKSQVSAIYEVAPMESLSYAFGALHYAIAVRMMVANAVQDGPLGGTGLHLSIKEAAEFLQSVFDPGDDLVGEMTQRISSSISAEYDQSFFGGSVDVVISSTLTGDRDAFTIERDSGFRDTFPFLPYRESDASFAARVNEAAEEAYDDMYRDIYADLGLQDYLNTAGDVNAWLAQSEQNVSDIYEQVGSNAQDDIGSGTSKADYFTGLGGDDTFFGANGPDALSGGSGNDILRGGALQDMLRGGTGNDMMFGNETYGDPVDGDTARFAGLSTDYSVTGGQTYAVVSGPDGERDKLFNIEFLRFDDVVVTLAEGSALDGAGDPEDFDVAERVALMYEAALDRNGQIDLPGLNFYIDVTSRDGLSDAFLAADLMTSPEFAEKFGEVDSLSNDAFLEQIYLNVLDRESDAAGRQFYLDLLDDGTISRALALADIAISPENTNGSTQVLQSLYESSGGDWRFYDDSLAVV